MTLKVGGFLGTMTRGKSEKRLPISQISSVQFKPAGKITRGYISFTMPGAQEKQSRATKNVQRAWEDENSMVFLSDANKDFEILRDAVESAISNLGSPVVAASSHGDEIARLATLHKEGILSDEEFTAAKKKVLGL